MINNSLNEKISKYVELQRQEEQLKKAKEELAAEIVKEMPSNKYVTPEGYTASISPRETFTYTDEDAIIGVLTDKKLGNYLVEKINAPLLNKSLKLGGELAESLSGWYVKKVKDTLTVKGALNG